MFTLNVRGVSWKSSKQPTTAYLMIEAEYITASDAAKEAVWLKKFIIDLGIVPTISDPIPLLCDNNGAIAQAKEPRSHHKSKHILRCFHLIREVVTTGDVVVERVLSTDNIADPLTKPLAQEVFEYHCTTMGLMHKGNWLYSKWEIDEYYVAYKPITFSCILFMFIEMKFIHCHSFVMFAMKFMSMCND